MMCKLADRTDTGIRRVLRLRASIGAGGDEMSMRNGRELAGQYERRDDEAEPSPTGSAGRWLLCLPHKHEWHALQSG
jgi:hypothetical protein